MIDGLTGVSVKPSSGVGLAGVRALCRRGEIDADDEVVTVLTGTGHKERYGTDVDARRINLDALGTNSQTSSSPDSVPPCAPGRGSPSETITVPQRLTTRRGCTRRPAPNLFGVTVRE